MVGTGLLMLPMIKDYKGDKPGDRQTKLNTKVIKLTENSEGKKVTKDSLNRGAGIFFTDGKSVLLLKRAEKGKDHGAWSLPGGRSKQGESKHSTAKRESKEECGHVKGSQIGKSDEINDGFHWTTYFYKVSNKFNCKLSHEHSDWKWIPFDELSKYTIHAVLDKKIDRYISTVKKKIGTSFREWLEF